MYVLQTFFFYFIWCTMKLKLLFWPFFAGCLSVAVPSQGTGLEDAVRCCMEGRKAEIGVAVIIQSKDTFVWNDGPRYPLMSVCKLFQALSVADYLERNHLSLQTPVTVSKSDLKPDTYSPMRDRYPDGGITLSVAELLEYSLQQSDNNACDILFRMTGGPEATDRYIRTKIGLENFCIAADEEAMHNDLSLCYSNWSSPLETARLLDALVTRPLFADTTLQRFIRQTMLDCDTGKDRLALPLQGTPARIGHKTGTGDRNEDGEIIGVNDVGFVYLPDGRYYTIAVFIKDSQEDMVQTAQAIAEISRIVYQYVESLR
jgi:beta-lactamase class A